jgi:hypothetical protein
MDKFFSNISEHIEITTQNLLSLDCIDMLAFSPDHFCKIIELTDIDILEFSKYLYSTDALLFILLAYILLTAMVGAITLAMLLKSIIKTSLSTIFNTIFFLLVTVTPEYLSTKEILLK